MHGFSQILTSAAVHNGTHGAEPYLAAAIFIASYIIIATDKIDRTIVAMVGAALMLIVGLVEQVDAFNYIDLKVILLLAGMMIVVNIVKRSGLFEWLAISTAKLTGGRPLLLLITLSFVTAVVSAFLDNVTTMMLIAPMTLLIANMLRINPVPLLISETLASNIGGTATLIGDPPNLLVGSAANFSFLDFLTNMAPIVFVILIVFLFMDWGMFGKKMKKIHPNLAAMTSLDPRKVIKDKLLLWESIIVLVLIFVAFVVHDMLGLKPATIAISGAALLLIITQINNMIGPKQHRIGSIDELFSEIDWHTLFFFIGMFIMIAGLEASGVIGIILSALTNLTNLSPFFLAMLIMWGAAVLTMVTSAVPFVIAMVPIINGLAALPEFSAHINVMWWSLALGACLGANGTFVGSAANMVVIGISNKSGHPITFKQFSKQGLPITFVSLLLSSVYIWIRYFLLA